MRNKLIWVWNDMRVNDRKVHFWVKYSFKEWKKEGNLTICSFILQWHSLSREEQAKYYEIARKERQLHSQLYPGWSARDNYVSEPRMQSLMQIMWDSDSSIVFGSQGSFSLSNTSNLLQIMSVRRERRRNGRERINLIPHKRVSVTGHLYFFLNFCMHDLLLNLSFFSSSIPVGPIIQLIDHVQFNFDIRS